ncbi:MAG TPA: 1-deoxy-D-xylulose-5-phosphate synthase [Pirellulales bacterium]|jgi:1-deoxy-D-xylulose-5-phosphate synthase|nr:1-deoxy-D-xylulose-5-phosphate synthase [Pirellulales bacterium]
MDTLLSKIESPRDLQGLSLVELEQLASDVRTALCNLVTSRTAHFASNLGVVELAIALHVTFDFSRDRLIWDTGHQAYPHKLLTGRYDEFGTIRTKGGLSGFPNPNESPYDLFMTGHAGCSVSTALGLKSGDDLQPGEEDRHAVAVIGDGAFPSGIVFEAMNNAGGLKKKLLVILNDNKMSICPRVGGVAEYLDRLRMNPFYTGLKQEVVKALGKVPLLGDPMERMLWQVKESVKAGLHGGMLFEELGFRYMGPIDGHNIAQLNKYLRLVKDVEGPVLLHVVTEKGHGFKPAAQDPVFFHTPAPFECDDDGVVSIKKSSTRSYTNVASDAIFQHMTDNPKVTVMTAAMCQGNNLEKIRDAFPTRFFDTGICESHAVAFAAGQAKADMHPIVDIYSTFLQRSYDQIFQEVALQNLPVIFTLDRAGLTGPEGPTHHGMFDLGYMRLFPNMTVMAPGDESDLIAMLAFSLEHNGPVSIRYPKTGADQIEREPQPIELGKAEVIETGRDGTIIACGTLLSTCIKAAAELSEQGLDVGVINARFVKPLDTATILRAVQQSLFVLTVEEGALQGGFGSAILEAAADAGIPAAHVRRLGVPDRFIEHGERSELLADLGLDVAGIVRAAREMAERVDLPQPVDSRIRAG